MKAGTAGKGEAEPTAPAVPACSQAVVVAMGMAGYQLRLLKHGLPGYGTSTTVGYS